MQDAVQVLRSHQNEHLVIPVLKDFDWRQDEPLEIRVTVNHVVDLLLKNSIPKVNC